MMHKTYLSLGSSPKFYIGPLDGKFFGETRTFGVLMSNALKGTILDGFPFWMVPRPIGDKGSWASKGRWLDWVWLSADYWGCYMNRFVRESHRVPQGKNAISS